jgi:hypothetical protein
LVGFKSAHEIVLGYYAAAGYVDLVGVSGFFGFDLEYRFRGWKIAGVEKF